MECPVDVPFTVIGVSFRRGMAASSAESVSFSFIHSKDVPVSSPFPVSPWGENALRPAHNRCIALTIIDRLFSCELP
jgi:hypothetical protein